MVSALEILDQILLRTELRDGYELKIGGLVTALVPLSLNFFHTTDPLSTSSKVVETGARLLLRFRPFLEVIKTRLPNYSGSLVPKYYINLASNSENV